MYLRVRAWGGADNFCDPISGGERGQARPLLARNNEENDMNKLTTLALSAALAFTLTGCPAEGGKTAAPAGDAKTAAEGAARCSAT